MIRQPDIYTPTAIKGWSVQTEGKNGRWVPARPMAHNAWSWKVRWKYALKVLVGHYDVLKWEEERRK